MGILQSASLEQTPYSFGKFVYNISADYTRYTIPKSQQAEYSLRRPDIIGQINTRTVSLKNSFCPHCLPEWNKLDIDNRSSPSLSIFKTKLLKCIRSTPKLIYGNLNFHKFRHNFKDAVNPLCPANDGVEGTEHFLLHCHSSEVPMSDLLNSASAILLPYGFSSLSNEVLFKHMLCGDESLTFETNKKLLEATLKFMQATERF